MSDKSKFFDYEPISRRKNADRRLNQPADDFPRRSRSESTSTSPAKGATAFTNSAERIAPATSSHATTLPTAILKRAHSLSFLGLFLFTFVLYARPYELSSSLDWTQGIAFWIAIVTIAIYLPTQLGAEGRITIRPREVNLILLLFLAAIISVPFGTDIQNSWNALNEYLKVVLMFIVFVNVVRTEWRLRILMITILIVTCMISFAAVNDYRLGILGSNGQRVKGIVGGMFDNPNDLALHLVTLIPISVVLIFGSKAGLKKLFYAACAILMTAGVVVSFSRGGFLGLASMAGVLGWRIARRNKGILLLLPLLIAAFIALAPGGYGTRLATTSDGSAQERTDDLKRSIFVAVRHPLWGVGLNNYSIYSNKEHASHNAYSEVASEVGLPALVIYILFLIAPIKELRKIIRETQPKGPRARFHYLAIGLEASLIGYMVSSFFASVAFLWYVYYLIGYSVCLRRLYAASEVRDAQIAPAKSLDNTRAVESPLVAAKPSRVLESGI